MVASSAGPAPVAPDAQAGFCGPGRSHRGSLAGERQPGRPLRARRRRALPEVPIRREAGDKGCRPAAGTAGRRPKAGGDFASLLTENGLPAFCRRVELDRRLRERRFSLLAVGGTGPDHGRGTMAMTAGDLRFDAARRSGRHTPFRVTVSAEGAARRTAPSRHGEFCQVGSTSQLPAGLD